MLSIAEIQHIIAQGESETTEFKQEFTADPIRKSLGAFSNDFLERGAGVILVGVKDDGTLKNVTDIDKTLLNLTNLCRDSNTTPSIMPDMYAVEMDSKTIIVVEVRQSLRRPHRANNICYIRIGSSNRAASTDEEFEIIRKTSKMPYDLLPMRTARIEDLDNYKFESEFLPRRVTPELLQMNGRTLAEWLLHIRFVYKEDAQFVPTIAALLLFGKQPDRFIPHANIDFIRFEGTDPSYPIVDRKTLNGALDNLIKMATELIERSMLHSYKFSDKSPQRIDIVEYPLRAIREAIANAVVHRDYEVTNSCVSIKMYDDRVEIMSPGGLYGIVTKENFGTGINDYRNPTLATNLNILGLVEKAGTGIFQIKRQMRENGSLEPTFELGDRYIITRLPAHPHYQAARAYQKALSTAENSQYAEARTYLNTALRILPDFAEAWSALGRLEGLQGNNSIAQNAFKTAISLNPFLEKTYYDWAKLEENNNELEESLTILKQGNTTIPNSSLLLIAEGQIHNRLKNFKDALKYYKTALKINPENPKITQLIANTNQILLSISDNTHNF